MARQDADLYWVQIKTPSYPTVHLLTRQLPPLAQGKPLCGPRMEAVWEVHSKTEIDVLSDEHLCIDGQLLHAELNHLPTHAYRALVEAAPKFTQYGDLDALYEIVRQPGRDPSQFVHLLEATVRAGRVENRVPRSVVVPQTYFAEWQPRATYLGRTSQAHWFLALSFRTWYRPAVPSPTKVKVGLDLGLAPMTTAYDSSGNIRTFHPTSLEHLRALGGVALSAPARRLLHDLVYSSGRQDAERIVAFLNVSASHVFAETLRQQGMNRDFVHTARALAIHDHHYSHMRQMFNTSGVFFARVPSAYTSVICAACLEREGVEVRGHRKGGRFFCPRCRQSYPDHGNAGHNLLIRGVRELRRSRR